MDKKKDDQMTETPQKSIKEEIKKRHSIIKKEVVEATKEITEEQKTSHINQAICHFAALGFSTKEIAIQLSVTKNRVAGVLRSETGQYQIQKLQRQLFVDNPQKMFMTEVPMAFRRVRKIIRDKKAKHTEALQAANSIFDRALGKPVQEVKAEGSVIRQLIELIDEKSKPKTIETLNVEAVSDAEFTEPEKEIKQKDDLDTWLDDNLD